MRRFVFAAFCLIHIATPAFAAREPQTVRIEGYADEAMEPFLSRDGRFLFFNSRNDPGVNTNIHFAEAKDGTFVYRGVLAGTVSYALDATPTMSADGRFCFVSPRDYRRALTSVYCGQFDGQRVDGIQPQTTLPAERQGRMIFDVELSSDGQTMLFAEGTFDDDEAPEDADIYLATPGPRGFVRAANSGKMLARINTSDLEYAPALSADGLELYFTRVTGFWLLRKPRIFRARRNSVDEAFGKPVELEDIEGYVEGPSIANDDMLYFHRRLDDRYAIWRIPR
jgi:WD40-like Beta Propeller Repeat